MTTMSATSVAIRPDVTASRAAPLLSIDAAAFRAGFDQAPFRIQHRLTDHPLFALERLIQLATQLPPASVEYNAGSVPIGVDPAKTPMNGLSVNETLERIATCKSWMALKNVEQVPEYQALLDACLAEVRVHSEPLDPGMEETEGFIFVTSPKSVTPFHIDPEHNFLLQIRGTKFFHIWPRDDRSILTDEQLEGFYMGAHRNIDYKDEFAAKGQCFELKPGDGLHGPVTCPHWVQNGDEVSVSFSVTFRTPRSHKRGQVYMMNARMRSWGWKPRPHGSAFDGLKCLSWRIISKIDRFLGRNAAGGKKSY